MRPVQVLVVDDNADARLLLSEVLSLKGYRVEAVASGREALTRVRRRLPGIVLLDLQMPEMDGFATLSAIRELAPSLPVIAVSGHVLPDDEQRIRAAGFDDSMSKPLRIDDLLVAVERVLGRANAGDDPG